MKFNHLCIILASGLILHIHPSASFSAAYYCWLYFGPCRYMKTPWFCYLIPTHMFLVKSILHISACTCQFWHCMIFLALTHDIKHWYLPPFFLWISYFNSISLWLTKANPEVYWPLGILSRHPCTLVMGLIMVIVRKRITSNEQVCCKIKLWALRFGKIFV